MCVYVCVCGFNVICTGLKDQDVWGRGGEVYGGANLGAALNNFCLKVDTLKL